MPLTFPNPASQRPSPRCVRRRPTKTEIGAADLVNGFGAAKGRTLPEAFWTGAGDRLDDVLPLFEGDARVLTVSVHAEKNFPARKAASTLDLPLPDGATDAVYLAAVEVALARLADFPADILFYNAGVDVAAGDRLGRLAVGPEGLRAREARVLSFARSRGLPLAGVLGGGYGAAPEEVAARHAVLFEEAAKSGSLGP